MAQGFGGGAGGREFGAGGYGAGEQGGGQVRGALAGQLVESAGKGGGALFGDGEIANIRRIECKSFKPFL